MTPARASPICLYPAGFGWIPSVFTIADPNSKPQLKKNIVKMEIDENPRKPEDQEVERGVWGGNRNLKGVAFS